MSSKLQQKQVVEVAVAKDEYWATVMEWDDDNGLRWVITGWANHINYFPSASKPYIQRHEKPGRWAVIETEQVIQLNKSEFLLAMVQWSDSPHLNFIDMSEVWPNAGVNNRIAFAILSSRINSAKELAI